MQTKTTKYTEGLAGAVVVTGGVDSWKPLARAARATIGNHTSWKNAALTIAVDRRRLLLR